MLAPDEAALATCEAAWVRLAALSAPEASWIHDSLTDFLRTGEGVVEDILRRKRNGEMNLCGGECRERDVSVRVAVRNERDIRIVVAGRTVRRRGFGDVGLTVGWAGGSRCGWMGSSCRLWRVI